MIRRLQALPAAVFLLCLFFLTACATDNKKASWDQDKPTVTQSIQDIQSEQQRLGDFNRLQAAEVASLTTRMDALEALNQEYQLQQAQIQALSAQIEGLQRKQAKKLRSSSAHTPSPAHTRVTTVKKHPAQPVAAAPADVAPPSQPVVDTAAQADAEKNAYTAAYLALKSGRYDEAANGFNKQLDLYPKGEYSDQAWYWLGETRLAQNDGAKALNAFKYVVDHYPSSVKHAAALFKMAQISVDNKQPARAIEYYKRLIQEHADSDMAEQARAALNALEHPATESGQ
ncbi:tetratricopeptide repeat protein [Mariprofundus ferrooxydans]|uniref:tetratricopeptide repeat protein n=1 Tax=Mariprofundus ferrooxydans TaxID=314344 RepID=UPI00036B2781|nr:tetratricopeptide repeat protein [Mariprofundus ferrooxydans]